MKSKELRQQFLNFFNKKQHEIVASAPIVIKDDPTLMFTNAGMNQFKEFFLGHGKPYALRIADTQKCLRVSGKHNDLEEVGKDTYHHTMFEMLGNWSFGDYFKKEAISWAWEFLTDTLKIDKDILYVTIFEGDASEGLERDSEAYNYWKELIPTERILLGNKKDNFWEMGEQGPCGPCSEIHVDIRSEKDRQNKSGAKLVNMDHPEVVEIWNLVFMQYNRKADGSLENLPSQHVDTGMGFERLCMVMQNVRSNYDTDIFTPLIKEIETITSNEYGISEDVSIAIRVIADHIRAVAFAIADGQLPSNNGAGYVIRRILRRAIRYGFTFLNQKEPFIYKLVYTLVEQMGEAFQELVTEKNLIVNVVKEEEIAFLRTLGQGLILLDRIIINNNGKEVSGRKVFELKDTYGFPEDLTQLILEEKGYTYNKTEFDEALNKQKETSKSASVSQTEDWIVLKEDDDEEFVGYDTLESNVKIVKYRKVTNKKDGELFHLVFNLTPFYPEGGGQVGDKGYLESPNGDVVYIVNTKKENNLIIHYAKSLPKNTAETFKAVVDRVQRNRAASNHTATHLLHQALKTILGDHVEQKGSLVSSRYLRFDFSHFSKVSSEQIKQVEHFVNARIREGLELKEQRNVPFQKAIDEGATALFGEKYGDTVRSIRFGESIELCGGTHVQNTLEIWYFKIRNESAVASGVRRIEAITNDTVGDYFEEIDTEYKEIKAVLNNTKEPVKNIISLQEENNALRKQVEQLLKEKAGNLKNEIKSKIKQIKGVNLLTEIVDLNPEGVKNLVYELGGEVDNMVIGIGSQNKGKALLTIYIAKNLVEEKDLNAGQMVRELGKFILG